MQWTDVVSWSAARGKWQAQLWHAGKRRNVGRFNEERDAIDAVRAAREAAAENRLEEHKTELRAAAAAWRVSGQS